MSGKNRKECVLKYVDDDDGDGDNYSNAFARIDVENKRKGNTMVAESSNAGILSR